MLELADLTNSARDGILSALVAKMLSDPIKLESHFNKNSYKVGVSFILSNICKDLGITDNDEINTRVQEALFALGLEAGKIPIYLRGLNDSKD